MIRAFSSLTEDIKNQGIHPGFHFMDNEATTALKLTMMTMNIKYQVVLPSKHIENNADRAIQTIKDHFIVGMCSVDTYFYLQLWDRLLQDTTISINLLRQ